MKRSRPEYCVATALKGPEGVPQVLTGAAVTVETTVDLTVPVELITKKFCVYMLETVTVAKAVTISVAASAVVTDSIIIVIEEMVVGTKITRALSVKVTVTVAAVGEAVTVS